MSARRKGDCATAGVWLRRISENYLGAWLIDLFQAPMASAAASGPAPSTGGPLSFMGCMREASPPPYESHQQRPTGLPTGELVQFGAHGFDSMPKEPKKRRFHPLRGLRRIFRKKSRGAADARLSSPGSGGEREVNGEHMTRVDREEVTLRDPAGRPEEIRSRSASELLTDSCDRERLFLQRRGIEESFINLQRGGVGQLSVSHDSVFPGEVPQTRPLSSLDTHGSLERRSIKANSNDADQKESQSAQRHRISLRVLEQIKTVIENRNQIAVAGTTTSTTGTTTTTITTTTTTTTTSVTPMTEIANPLHNRFGSRDRGDIEDAPAKEQRKDAPAPTNAPATETPSSLPFKEDLPELKVGCLNHTAALHRISVRPKNRRPPRRSNSQSSSANNSATSQLRIDSISENSIDTMDSLETSGESVTRPISILRKSSSRVSRSSVDEPEAKSPNVRKPTLSPDSLGSSPEALNVVDVPEETPKPSPRMTNGHDSRRISNRLSKSPDSLESSSPGWFIKAIDNFDEPEGDDLLAPQKPVAATRRLLHDSISKSQERVCHRKSSDSLEALNSDDSMERRRASFEIRPRRAQVHKLMSKSSECFEAGLLESQQRVSRPEEARKRASLSEMNLSGARLLGKPLSESVESIERVVPSSGKPVDGPMDGIRRLGRRAVHSFESSDNLELDDSTKLEIRVRSRRSTPIKLGDGVDILEATLLRKSSPRLQKSSESSELGSTDTLDSERRNTTKSSDSEETLDSLEKELQDQGQDIKDMDIMGKDEVIEVTVEEPEEETDEKIGSYWRRRTDSQDSPREVNNLDIHQLLAYTLVSRVQENGNNDDDNQDENRPAKNMCANSPVALYPKKRQHQQHMVMQQQSSSENHKTLSTTINNLLSSKTDEDLQNMLNGNISEVSTDTKSFKEKLIMFEKLGK